MLATAPFHRVRNVSELAYVMRGYDEGSEWPAGSGCSFTAGLAPRPWAVGFRMASYAGTLMQAMQETLPPRYAGPLDFPMKTVAQACRHVSGKNKSGAQTDGARLSASRIMRSRHRCTRERFGHLAGKLAYQRAEGVEVGSVDNDPDTRRNADRNAPGAGCFSDASGLAGKCLSVNGTSRPCIADRRASGKQSFREGRCWSETA